MQQPDIYKEAQKRVKEKAKFFKHLYSYVIINGVLFLMTMMNGEPFGSMMVAIFWGIGLAFHYLRVFGIPGSGILSREWEDKEIDKEMERMKGRGTKMEEPEQEQLELKVPLKKYNDSDLV